MNQASGIYNVLTESDNIFNFTSSQTMRRKVSLQKLELVSGDNLVFFVYLSQIISHESETNGLVNWQSTKDN